MRFIIETNLASKPAWWLLDDDNRVLAGPDEPSSASPTPISQPMTSG